MSDTDNTIDSEVDKILNMLAYRNADNGGRVNHEALKEAKAKLGHTIAQENENYLETHAHNTEDGWCCACDYDITVMKNEIAQEVNKAVAKGMEQAKSRVLRRTEIPADAREPTRDAIVILGEEIADIIQRDIDALTADKESND